MTETARYLLSARRTGAGAQGRNRGRNRGRDQGRKVMGKTLVAVSAVGMLAVLVALVQARYLLAGSAFLLTVGVLEIMFQRALALFHGSAAALPAPGHVIGHRAPRHAAAGE